MLLDEWDYSKNSSQFLFPANTENGCITCKAVEDYHRRLCKKLGILVTTKPYKTKSQEC